MAAGDVTPERIVRLEDDAVVVLDQRRLPDEEVDLRCTSAAEVAEAIRTPVSYTHLTLPTNREV